MHDDLTAAELDAAARPWEVVMCIGLFLVFLGFGAAALMKG